MKLVEFLGRKAAFEARERRAWVLGLSGAVVAAVAAAVIALAGPSGKASATPRWLRESLPMWILGLGGIGPVAVVALLPRRRRRAGLNCPKCGDSVAGIRGEIVTETLCCPHCRERIIEDGRRPDLNWALLEPRAVGGWRTPRWPATAPRPDLRRRLGLYRRRTRGLLAAGTVGAGLVLGWTASVGGWVPVLERVSHALARGGGSGLDGAAVPGRTRQVGLLLLALAAPWILGPWWLIRQHARALTQLRLRCPSCTAPLPPRAGLAVALGRCGACGGAVDSEPGRGPGPWAGALPDPGRPRRGRWE